MRRRMRTSLIALAAALFSWPAAADTLVNNVNGIQVGADGKLQHFRALHDRRRRQGPAGARASRARAPRQHHEPRSTAAAGRLLPGPDRRARPCHGPRPRRAPARPRRHQLARATFSSGCAPMRPRDKDPWLIGRGWNQELWSEKRFPTAADLDAAVADRPVVLERVDGHAIVVNSAALKAAGITSATKDPVGGKIERNADGNPTGLLVDAARNWSARSFRLRRTPSATKRSPRHRKHCCLSA